MTNLEKFSTLFPDRPIVARVIAALCLVVAAAQAVVCGAIAAIGGHLEPTLLATAVALVAIAGGAIWLTGPAKESRDLL